MYKAELREKGFDGQHINPKMGIIMLTQLALIIIMIAFGLLCPYIIAGILEIDDESDLTFFQSINEDIMEFMGQIAIFVFFIVFMILYFALKILVTSLFCERNNSIALTILKRNSMPIFLCREAFSVRHTVIIYFLPAFLMYSLLFICNFLSLFNRSNMIYVVSTILLSFFLSSDVTIVLYTLYMKIKTGIAYISIDEHIYSVTLFYKTKLEETQPEEVKTVTESSGAEDDIIDEEKESTSIPTAPGQNFLKVTGIFYTAAGGISIISALLVRFMKWGLTDTLIQSIVSFIHRAAQDDILIWRLTAMNNVLAMLQRLHITLPELELSSISAMSSRVPGTPVHIFYAIYLSLPINYTISSTILTFAAVIIGIFVAFTGIVAVKYCATLKYAKLLVIFAFINLGMMIISTIFLVSFFSILGCVIAALYFAGAFQNYITYKKAYAKTNKRVYIKKIVKYVVITAAPILCMIILFTTLFQSKEVRLINDSKFYLNGDNDSAYIHIIDENHLQLVDFDMDKLTRSFEEHLGFNENDLEFIRKAYSGKIEFEVGDNRLNLILPKYKGYDIAFFITYINENTFFFRKEQYIKQ